jgi:hypothetical protein
MTRALSREGTQARARPFLGGKCGVKLVPTRPERYRAKAEECAKLAKGAFDPETKHLYLDLARQWLDLAKWAEEGGDGSLSWSISEIATTQARPGWQHQVFPCGRCALTRMPGGHKAIAGSMNNTKQVRRVPFWEQ